MKKKERYAAYAKRARRDLEDYVTARGDLFDGLTGPWPTDEDLQ